MESLKKNFTSWESLVDFLELNEEQKRSVLRKNPFPINFPYRFAKKVKKGTLDDPLIKQFLPLVDEEETKEGFTSDPVEELSFYRSKKLLQKYDNRALLLSTSACGMHCRFCFRRNFPYEVERKQWDEELEILEKDRSLSEVILSGGDPLSLPNRQLEHLFSSLEKMPHIERIRIHTRFHLAFPERIDEGFLKIIEDSSKQVIFVTHANHPKEFDADVFAALRNLQKLGVMLLSQSCLLKGINDNKETLAELFLNLANHGVVPYYLHQLDRVSGAHHFEVPVKRGLELIEELMKELPGYAVPKYVQEIPNKPSKTPLHLVDSSDT